MAGEAPLRECLVDLLDNIMRIEGYVVGLPRTVLEADDLRRDAVERCLERIGQVFVQLGNRLSIVSETLPDAKIRWLADVLHPATRPVAFDVLWDIVEFDLPGFRTDASRALAGFASPEPDDAQD